MSLLRAHEIEDDFKRAADLLGIKVSTVLSPENAAQIVEKIRELVNSVPALNAEKERLSKELKSTLCRTEAES